MFLSDCLYSERHFRDQARYFVKRNAPRGPFFLEVAFHGTHDAWVGTKRATLHYQTVKDGKSGGNLTPTNPSLDYWPIVEELDAAVGDGIEALEESGVRDNTLIIFTADQGAEGEGGYGDPDLRGRKKTVEEGGIREGLLVQAPTQPCTFCSESLNGCSTSSTRKAAVAFDGMDDAETGVDFIASQVDLLPTIAEVCIAYGPVRSRRRWRV